MISFPASPSSGQQYSEGGTTWEYNGTVWNVIAETTGEQTVDNIQIGVTTNNTIDTTTGNLELDSATGMTYVVDDLYVTGSIDFLGTLSQNGSMVDTGNPDPRIVREESGTDVTYTFN